MVVKCDFFSFNGLHSNAYVFIPFAPASHDFFLLLSWTHE